MQQVHKVRRRHFFSFWRSVPSEGLGNAYLLEHTMVERSACHYWTYMPLQKRMQDVPADNAEEKVNYLLFFYNFL